MKFSVIVPVYNRVSEVEELLESLSKQSVRNFEVIIVEDGSTEPCKEVADRYSGQIDLKYYYKSNEGRSIARNYGIERAEGNFFVFFDSDCVIPPNYFETLGKKFAEKGKIDCYGGPDAASKTFSRTQRAINYSMTSFLTTGGIRGGKISMEKFVPRSFNMGYADYVWQKAGGFREMFSEDIDMSTRIKQAGFSSMLIRELPVWHKRRVDFKKFFKQVHVFGRSRITLKLLYPGSMKLVHWLPALFVLGCIALVVLGCTVSPWFFLALGIYILGVWLGALISTKDIIVSFLAVPAAFVQLFGYGTGFIRAYFTKIILGRGRDIEEEIAARKGK